MNNDLPFYIRIFDNYIFRLCVAAIFAVAGVLWFMCVQYMLDYAPVNTFPGMLILLSSGITFHGLLRLIILFATPNELDN